MIACDISEFQPVLTDAYPHRWVTFRACDGDYLDEHAAANLAWATGALKAGRLTGFGVYVVYRPGKNGAILAHLDGLGIPASATVMVDCESWDGQISGNRTAELNALADSLVNRQGARARVWGYGNRGDLAALWPGRPAWLGIVVASYGGDRPTDVANMVGWQYTDGTHDVPGLPSASAPFGPCDHNELYLTAAPDAGTATPLTLEDDMYTLFQVVPNTTDAGRVYAVRAGTAPIWLSPTTLETLGAFGLLTNPGKPKPILMIQIARLAAIVKGSN